MKLTENQKKMAVEALDSMGDGLVSYSGRGMYGASCASIQGSIRDCNQNVAEAIKSLVSDVINETHDCNDTDEELNKVHKMQEDVDNIIEFLIVNQKIDNMGRDYVMYWEQLPMLEEIETE